MVSVFDTAIGARLAEIIQLIESAPVAGENPPPVCPVVVPSLNTYAVFIRADGTRRIGFPSSEMTFVLKALTATKNKYVRLFTVKQKKKHYKRLQRHKQG